MFSYTLPGFGIDRGDDSMNTQWSINIPITGMPDMAKAAVFLALSCRIGGWAIGGDALDQAGVTPFFKIRFACLRVSPYGGGYKISST
jgi:hypothetical protein